MDSAKACVWLQASWRTSANPALFGNLLKRLRRFCVGTVPHLLGKLFMVLTDIQRWFFFFFLDLLETSSHLEQHE